MLGWLMYQRLSRKTAIIGFIAIAMALFPIAQLVSVFGCRARVTSVEDGVVAVEDGVVARFAVYQKIVGWKNLLAFKHDQGSTMVYLYPARQITDYPWPAHVQTFLPGFGALMALSGHRQDLSNLYFGQYLSKIVVPERYAKGEAVGWALYGDFQVFSRGILPIYIAIAFVIGTLFAALCKAAERNQIWFGALVCIFPKIMLLPRAGLYSIFPFLAVFLAIVGLWKVAVFLITRGVVPIPPSLQSLIPHERRPESKPT